jgi:peptide/bleomycin uptake transporter
VLSWSTIVELISVYKRLRAFESRIHEPAVAPPDDGLAPLNP